VLIKFSESRRCARVLPMIWSLVCWKWRWDNYGVTRVGFDVHLERLADLGEEKGMSDGKKYE